MMLAQKQLSMQKSMRSSGDKLIVDVLNGQVETFETRPVNIGLESVNGNASMDVTVYTTTRVTGNMPFIDRNRDKRYWRHIEGIEFPRSAKRPLVDALIGIDCADLLNAIEEIRGRPGEPITRLTPLGWTCAGNTGLASRPILQTSFKTTYFTRDISEIERLNETLKRFWEIEDTSSFAETPRVRIEEQSALKKVQRSMTYGNQMYWVAIPWKDRKQVSPDNYKMALRRLENTEKRLIRSPDIAKTYKGIIEE